MNKKEKSFENAVAELEILIRELENGTLPLEQMINRISEGAALIRYCQDKLNTMNGKVEMLFKDDGQQGVFTAFDSTTDRSRAANTPPVKPAAPQDELPF